jgi:hypothetical protein
MYRPFLISLGLVFTAVLPLAAYPIDGYWHTCINRLIYQQKVEAGTAKGRILPPGALLSVDSIQLNLFGREDQPFGVFPASDPVLQDKVDALLAGLPTSYSVAILDMTPDRELRYAEKRATRGFQPGSVGKIAVINALFCELESLYLDSFQYRIDLLKSKVVRGGKFAVYDHHTIPIFDAATDRFVKRQAKESDAFTLFEWADHMMSVSNNGAASVVWREAILMRVFGSAYPLLTEEEARAYFAETPRSELAEIARDVVNGPLLSLGIEPEEWRLGQMFTRGATSIVPGKGGSIGTPRGLIKYLIALESGRVVDYHSSLEIKRLMYMTDRRIRYGRAPQLDSAALYFKSGSLYSCNRSLPGSCGEYAGNAMNYMNSVAIIEQAVGPRYMVVLMTNVLSRNSASDHYYLAGKIDAVLRSLSIDETGLNSS